jgi:D-lactate dehydrogenase (cytochrome)
MIPYGSGTSLEGHTSAPQGGVFIDVSRMQRIRSLHVSDMDCVVEPGISWNNLNAELKEHGLFYPVDPGPGASIGGMVATSCSGTNAVRYGTMKFNVLNLTVVLPDGRIVKTGNRARKSSAGYDLTRLFVGSEGTLGIVTEITLRLSNIPQATAVATCHFDSLASASKSVIELLQRGVRVGCVELLDDGCVRAVNAYAGLSYPAKPATLFFKFTGSEAGVQDDVAQAASITASHGAGPLTFATEVDARERIWEARKGALWGCIAYRPGCEAWTTDVCVPISRMAECIEATKKDLIELSGATAADGSGSSSSQRQLFPSAVVGHVGDGNFHVIMMLDPSSAEELSVAREVNERMVRRAIDMEGTCTGEHGVGVGKKKYLEAELGAPALDLMRTLKRALDPHNLMNPGKVFDMEPSSSADEKITNPHAHKHAAGNGCC